MNLLKLPFANDSNTLDKGFYSELSCYTAKLYNPNILNSCVTGKMPVTLIQIKCTTAYEEAIFSFEKATELNPSDEYSWQ
ncbi:MAG: hypothetical protein ACKPE3_19895, partial [Sphaerospermopsis kisseleviana]